MEDVFKISDDYKNVRSVVIIDTVFDDECQCTWADFLNVSTRCEPAYGDDGNGIVIDPIGD